MAADRDKITRNALRYIQKGQYAKAVEEYKKLLAADPQDIRARLRLVDLYGRLGRKKEAVEESRKVAETYAEQGFYLKAIAVYKQALRHDPDNPDLWRSIGEMYAKQGLVGDALNAFKRGVDALRRQGLNAEAQELLGRMEALSPDNAAIKAHLAEIHLEEGRFDAFEEVLSKLVLQLRGEGRNRKLLRLLERFYELSNHHPAVLKRLAELYVDLGEEEKALEVIREGLESDPDNPDLRLLALRAYLVLGQLAEARKVALALLEDRPDDLYLLEQIASIAQARGDRAELAEAYRAMARVYAQQGLSDKEEACYKKILELFPDDAEARLAMGKVAVPEAKPAPSPVEPSWMGEQKEPEDSLDQGAVEADLYLKYGLEDKAEEKLLELVDRAPDRLDLHQKLRDLYHRRGNREAWVREQLRIGELLLREGRDAEALRAYESVLEVAPDNPEARKAIRYFRPEAVAPGPDAIEIELDPGSLEFVEGEGGEQVVHRGPAHAVPEEDEALLQALAEADFLVSQGRRDEAVEVLLRLRDRHPDSPHVTSRLARLGWEEPGPQEDVGEEILQGFEGFEDFEVSELDDILQEFRSGVAQKLDESDFETHYNLGVAYREMGLMEDALREFQAAARSPEKAREAYAAMAMVYRELGNRKDARAALQMALAVPTASAEDRAAVLYELGDLSEEEGDPEAALRFFEKAAREAPGFRDVAARIRRLRSGGDAV